MRRTPQHDVALVSLQAKVRSFETPTPPLSDPTDMASLRRRIYTPNDVAIHNTREVRHIHAICACRRRAQRWPVGEWLPFMRFVVNPCVCAPTPRLWLPFAGLLGLLLSQGVRPDAPAHPAAR